MTAEALLERGARPTTVERLSFAVAVLTLVLLVLCAVTYVRHAAALIAFPFDVDPGEGFDVNGAVELLAGRSLYADATQFPFFALNYPPLYPLVLAPLVAAFGPSLSVARILSVVAGLGTAVAIALAVS